jgi:hypothetical protein
MAVVTTDRILKWGGSTVAIVIGLWGFHTWLASDHLPKHLITTAQAQELRSEVKGAVEAAKIAGDKASAASDAATQATVEVRVFLAQQELSRLQGELSQTKLWESQNGENDVSKRLKRELEDRIATSQHALLCLTEPTNPTC